MMEGWGVQSRPQLQGTFVLQLNEVVNIAAPVRDRCPASGVICSNWHQFTCLAPTHCNCCSGISQIPGGAV